MIAQQIIVMNERTNELENEWMKAVDRRILSRGVLKEFASHVQLAPFALARSAFSSRSKIHIILCGVARHCGFLALSSPCGATCVACMVAYLRQRSIVVDVASSYTPRNVLSAVAFLSAACILVFWEHGKKLWCLAGALSTSRWIVGNLQLDSILLFYCYCIIITIAPQGDALQKGTGGIYTCCIAVCLFMGT